MLNQNFVIVGVIISFLGGISYLIDTIKGKAKPNKVSFLLWGFGPLIAFFAEIRQGVGIQSLLTLTVGIIPLLIVAASFINNKAKWRIRNFDIACGVLSLIGLFFWYITKVGNLAIIFSIFADLLAGIPTIVKSYYYPETENLYGYLSSFIASILTLLTIRIWKFEFYGFPIYILLISFLISFLVKFKIGKILNE